MVNRAWLHWIVLGMVLVLTAAATAENGSIRGVVYDRDFDAPLPLAQVEVVETGDVVTATEAGNFLITDVPAGTYTLIFSKDGYTRDVRAGVVVADGQMTEVDAELAGEFTEMDEFLVQDLQIGGGTEAGLLRLRFDVPQLLDSISADFMSRAGASDAASALKLVAGASVEDGKFAVIRGLPDRYVNSQMNGVRLPTADEDKRAVQLDLFPAAVIESIQVSKTFTPDQQGDSSGGAVNVILKGVPDENFVQFKGELSYNTQAGGRDDFLTYEDGGVNFWGRDDGSRAEPLDFMFGGAAGVSRGSSPTEYKWSAAAGLSHTFDTGVKIGGFGSFFYERDSSFYDDGINDRWWQVNPGEGLVPRTTQGAPGIGTFKTSLFDETKGAKLVQWGGLATFGIESENHSINATYLYTRIAEDTATLLEDTRGKEYFFPGYDPDDPFADGNSPDNLDDAPYLRTETLLYTERTTTTFQLDGEHTLPIGGWGFDEVFTVLDPVFDWTWADSRATQWQPDKRQFGSVWEAASFNPGFPPLIPPTITPAIYKPFKPAENFLLGNFQRIWKDIEEESSQYALNLKIPFEQWTGDEGYFKVGIFDDVVVRNYDQNSYSNFNDNSTFEADFDTMWSDVFADEPGHDIDDGPPFIDVDYRGEQHISAIYAMADVPVTSWLNIIGGVRFEQTRLSIVNFPEANAEWFPEGSVVGILLQPGDGDVDYHQDDALPAIGFVLEPFKDITLRGSYTETVARQTFKELTPILQQEFLGSDIFIGNPFLKMAALENYDLRLDWTPYDGGLFSVSFFHKDVTDPIEYVQRVVTFTYTTPVNYPEGHLTGFEVEARQDLGRLWDRLHGLSIGANATLIDSEVTLPADEAAKFADEQVMAPIFARDMTATPEFLYNLYLTYDIEETGTQLALFYTVQGDTLVAGAGVTDGQFVPSVYSTEYGTLNFSISQRLGKHLKLTFKAKNLTDPDIREVYRSEFIGPDVVKTSYTKGIDLSIGLSAEIPF